MKKRHYIIIVVIFTIGFVFLLNRSVIFRSGNLIPKEEPDLRLETKDSKKDGKIDNGFYRDKNGVPVKWISDSNHDGRPDKWSFFKNGRAFLDEEDTDHDGKVDVIYLSIYDSQGIKQRVFSFALKDKEKNIFAIQEDTGWKTDDNIQGNEKSR